MDYFSTDTYIEPERGDLLISEPYLPDPNFERTVVFLCEHDENGTFGFVLNKPGNATFGQAIEEASGFDARLYIGGPVQMDSLHFLHKAHDQVEGGKEVVEDIYWGGDFEQLMTQINTRAIRENDFRFFVGYSGWSPGQLKEELETKSWIVYKKADPNLIFKLSAEELWPHVLKDMGGKFKIMANYPLDPRLN